MELSWDQVSVMAEYGLKLVHQDNKMKWIGFHSPKVQPFNYLDILQHNKMSELTQKVKIQQG